MQPTTTYRLHQGYGSVGLVEVVVPEHERVFFGRLVVIPSHAPDLKPKSCIEIQRGVIGPADLQRRAAQAPGGGHYEWQQAATLQNDIIAVELQRLGEPLTAQTRNQLTALAERSPGLAAGCSSIPAPVPRGIRRR